MRTETAKLTPAPSDFGGICFFAPKNLQKQNGLPCGFLQLSDQTIRQLLKSKLSLYTDPKKKKLPHQTVA